MGEEISISLTGTTELDVTAVQLLWAAARDAEQRRLGFMVTQPPELVPIARGRWFGIACQHSFGGSSRRLRRCQLNVEKKIQGRKGRART